jgi:hypothetical protein
MFATNQNHHQMKNFFLPLFLLSSTFIFGQVSNSQSNNVPKFQFYGQLGIGSLHEYNHGFVRAGKQLDYNMEGWMFDLISELTGGITDIQIRNVWGFGFNYIGFSDQKIYPVVGLQFDRYNIATAQTATLDGYTVNYDMVGQSNRVGIETGLGIGKQIGVGLKIGLGYRFSSFQGQLKFYQNETFLEERPALLPDGRESMFFTYGFFVPFNFDWGMFELNYTNNRIFAQPSRSISLIPSGHSSDDPGPPLIRFHEINLRLAVDLKFLIKRIAE